MKDITNNEMLFVLSIFKSPEKEYNANNMAKHLGISPMGALKIAKRLEKGDTIGIIAPSNPITSKRKYLLENAVKKFDGLGLKVVYSKNCFKVDKYGFSSGEPFERANDFNSMFSNPDVNAIYCAHGGDTAIQILSLIDYENIKKNPKIFLGMSDDELFEIFEDSQYFL